MSRALILPPTLAVIHEARIASILIAEIGPTALASKLGALPGYCRWLRSFSRKVAHARHTRAWDLKARANNARRGGASA